MSVDMNRDPAASNETERRAGHGDRVPFEGVVEVGGALGPSFEAQAIDVSAEGIHLRTAYLPELGQPLTCRIELGSDIVLASGEVVWRHEEGRGGEFGMRFTELDGASEAALKKLVTVEPLFAAQTAGSRVRLHIEGLGSPMRARIKGSAAEGLIVGSELGFLQVGKELELEDASTGGKRAARIHRVAVEVNPETQIPQLVVSLRYDVTDADVPVHSSEGEPAEAAGPEDTPEPSVIDDEKPRATVRGTGLPSREGNPKREREAHKRLSAETEEDPFGPMRSGMGDAFHRAQAKMGPALQRFGAQAMTTFGLVADRVRKVAAPKGDEAAPLTRRTTAPAPAGGLHASGRKVVRGEAASAMDAVEEKPKAPLARRRVAVGSAVLVAGVLALAAVHKPSPSPQPVATTELPSATNAAVNLPAGSGANAPPSPGAAPPPASATAPLPQGTSTLNSGSLGLAPQPPEETPPQPPSDDSRGHRKPLHVTPFGNGAVGHANVLHLKMDGPIEKIEGATTPTGFTVVIPDRRSLEAAAPLAARDSRIAAIRITNEANGAELAINFKDGVPNYQVRAKGDSLEILLAPQGKLTDPDDATKVTKKKHPRR